MNFVNVSNAATIMVGFFFGLGLKLSPKRRAAFFREIVHAYKRERHQRKLERAARSTRVRNVMFSEMRDLQQLWLLNHFADRLGKSLERYRERYREDRLTRLELDRPSRHGMAQVGSLAIGGGPFVLSVFCFTEGTGKPTTLAQAVFDLASTGKEITLFPSATLCYPLHHSEDALRDLQTYIALQGTPERPLDSPFP